MNMESIIDEIKFSKFRQELHKIPELKYKEFKTKKFIIDYLKNFKNFEKMSYKEAAETGFWFDLIGEGEKVEIKHPFLKKNDGSDNINEKYGIAFRCDIDGLPIVEKTSVEYKSTHEGCAHSCGHDGHITIMTAFIEFILNNINKIPSNIRLRFLYQQAEEGGIGAKVMIDNGCLEEINEIHGFHNYTSFYLNEVGLVKGPIMSCADFITIEVKGKGGHGSNPHLCNNPITTSSEIINKMNQIVSQQSDSKYRSSLSIGVFKSSKELEENIIPDYSLIKGSLRTFDENNRSNIKESIDYACEYIGKLNHCNCNVNYADTSPVTYNHYELTELVDIEACKKAGVKINSEGLPIMGSEDFSLYQVIIPGVFILLGTRDENHTFPIHSDYFDYNDKGTIFGVNIYCRIIEVQTGITLI